MQKMIIVASVCVAAWIATVAHAEPEAKPGPQTGQKTTAAAPADATHAADEQALRQAAEVFAKAYNAHDAAALAQLFVADGELINEAGQRFAGRAAIAQMFTAIFQADPQVEMKISIDSIRVVSPVVAVEEGVCTVTHLASGWAEHNRYIVVHAKQDGRWQMASARDLPDEEASAQEELKQLGWLVGEWVDESPQGLALTSYHWDAQHRAIVSRFHLQVGGQPTMNGTQRISWDPFTKKLHSWVFDSEGGFAEGTWTRSGNQWVIKMTGVTRDGRPSSATNVLTRVSQDRIGWQSRDRVVGDELQPNLQEIFIVRKPPLPGASQTGVGHDSKGGAK